MTTLDDKLLGEKTHYYCSSSEDEGEENDDDGKESSAADLGPSGRGTGGLKFVPEAAIREWEGNSTNTGPKGVIRDWQRFKQLESEKREQQAKERLALAKSLSVTVKSHLDDEKDKIKSEPPAPSEPEEDEFLAEYLAKRMKELMNAKTQTSVIFGKVFELTSADMFLEATEKNSQTTMVIVLLYEDKGNACRSMKNCLQYLASEYPQVKFCQMKASLVNLSAKFKSTGLPALQAYKSGELVGNYVQLAKEFGEDIYASDVESYLIEHGVLQDKTLVPSILRSKK